MTAPTADPATWSYQVPHTDTLPVNLFIPDCAADDVQLAWIYNAGPVDLTPPAGWNGPAITVGGFGAPGMQMYWHQSVVSGGGTTQSWTQPSGGNQRKWGASVVVHGAATAELVAGPPSFQMTAPSWSTHGSGLLGSGRLNDAFGNPHIPPQSLVMAVFMRDGMTTVDISHPHTAGAEMDYLIVPAGSTQIASSPGEDVDTIYQTFSGYDGSGEAFALVFSLAPAVFTLPTIGRLSVA